MDRLTKEALGCFAYDLKDHKHETGEFSTYEAFFNYSMAVKHLGEYEEAEEQGLLVRLPCKVGDIIFRIQENTTLCRGDYATCMLPTETCLYNYCNKYCHRFGALMVVSRNFEPNNDFNFKTMKLKRNVFLTHAEAEAALAKQR